MTTTSRLFYEFVLDGEKKINGSWDIMENDVVLAGWIEQVLKLLFQQRHCYRNSREKR